MIWNQNEHVLVELELLGSSIINCAPRSKCFPRHFTLALYLCHTPKVSDT